MTKQEFEEALENIPEWSYIFVKVKQEKIRWWEIWKFIGSVLTQTGTGEFCHVEVKIPDMHGEKNMVICANGKAVVIEKVKKYLTNWEKYELHIKRLKGLLDTDKMYMLDETMKQLNNKIEYDWKGIRGMTYKALLTKIPIVGFFINQFIWNLPSIQDKDKLFCVESAGRIGNAIPGGKRIPDRDGTSKYGLYETRPPAQLYAQENVWDKEEIVIGA